MVSKQTNLYKNNIIFDCFNVCIFDQILRKNHEINCSMNIYALQLSPIKSRMDLSVFIYTAVDIITQTINHDISRNEVIL